jgi:hypothetical protein
MIRGIDRYLDDFREELRGRDRALIQDALSDAEDHLTTGFQVERREHPELSEEDALRSVIESYGAPEEVAEHYRRVEEYTVPALESQGSGAKGRSGFRGFVGIVAEPSAWAAFLYMMISLATGILYFTWTVTGISLSVSLLILIVGVPIAWLFFLSFRGLALVEGRIVEALLGVRMPRRAVFIRKGEGWWGSLKGVFSTRSTWSSIVYLVLMLPLGVLYFSVFITLIALALSFIGSPVLELVFHEPVIDWPNAWWIPGWLYPVVVAAGGTLFLGALHLARGVGRLHGRLARAMLVS